MKLSEYIKKMTELLESEGDMDCIYRKDDEIPHLRWEKGNTYYKAESGYCGYADKDTLEGWEVECYCIDEASWLVENEYIDLVKVCIING
tara:strand:- start:203 stop:472 length:270 start_codon:yes stop_codon:yes gene_type:complete